MLVTGCKDSLSVKEGSFSNISLSASELFTMISMHGQTTGHEIFCQLGDSIIDAGLQWKSFSGITTDGMEKRTGGTC